MLKKIFVVAVSLIFSVLVGEEASANPYVPPVNGNKNPRTEGSDSRVIEPHPGTRSKPPIPAPTPISTPAPTPR